MPPKLFKLFTVLTTFTPEGRLSLLIGNLLLFVSEMFERTSWGVAAINSPLQESIIKLKLHGSYSSRGPLTSRFY